MAKDYTIHIEPVVRPLLEPAERLLAVTPLIKDPGATEDVSVSDELKNLLDPTILLGLGSHPGELLQRATFGRAVVGAPGSGGRVLFEAVDRLTSPTLVVTDSRLLVVELEMVERPGRSWTDRWFGPVEQVARLVHAVFRAAIVGAVEAPAGVLRRGRFLVVFADRSACALVGGPPKLGLAAAAAIGIPRPPVDAPGEEQA
ncbi:hypothetical protein BDK92_4067 [Micromonospora pisi]|uniref:Uncharacterized protein n=1 Tax=Micromonospora pisi TaxID=589240 RepID=A0A495JLJ0_9ACTN|nr:hypothetical protein [Micromonospora pisi]RKR89711.1 hypothetical protein BDK92_4067 [Micromonospora pisi]